MLPPPVGVRLDGLVDVGPNGVTEYVRVEPGPAGEQLHASRSTEGPTRR